MVEPMVAAVKPRVISSEDGDRLQLLDVVNDLLDEMENGVIVLDGVGGSGKSTALRHLAAFLAGDDRVLFCDEHEVEVAVSARALRPVIFAGNAALLGRVEHHLRLAPWHDDDSIEYLLATRPDACAHVIDRILLDPARHLLDEVPELWRPILDRLVEDPTSDIRAALGALLHDEIGDDVGGETGRFAFESFQPERSLDVEPQPRMTLSLPAPRRWLRHRGVRLALAVAWMERRIAAGDCEPLRAILSRDLIDELATRMRGSVPAITTLRAVASSEPEQSGWLGMIASVLHRIEPSWRPLSVLGARLQHAYLDEVDWSGHRLPNAMLLRASLNRARLEEVVLCDASLLMGQVNGACLRRADLARARLNGAQLVGTDLFGATLDLATLDDANLARANLAEASITGASMVRCSLDHADLRDADLRGSRLVDASVDGASFRRARLDDAEFSGAALGHADLHGARFDHAVLLGCDLEEIEIDDAHFVGATLDGALLSGARLRGALFTGASLRRTALADVDLVGADLRDADLTDATFHFGSSRSGLLLTPYAGEGSRTGFYTQEDEEMHFKAPEDVRAANLQFADLRGAVVQGADFYLVDLRGARMSMAQRRHFERCRAILS